MPLAVTRNERFILALLALLFVLGVAGLWLATQNLTLRGQNSALRTERELSEIAYRLAQNQLSERSLLAETMINDLGRRLHHSGDLARLKVSALAPTAGHTSAAQVIALWDQEQQTGLLTMEKLPVSADDQDYQIWLFDSARPNPVNGGVFHVRVDENLVLAFRPDLPVSKATGFAISLEKKGGAPTPEGPIAFLGK